MLINIENIYIQELPSFSTPACSVDILRLDLIHPVISGNKWFKLKYYLDDAISMQSHTLFTFGGAFSNHLVAVACAGQLHGLNTVGIVRGEASSQPSPTLQEAIGYGMKLIFTDRESYRNKAVLMSKYNSPGWYCIPEGGYGNLGSKGAADILRTTDYTSYSHIICACGTGTMVSGLMQAALPHQQVIGISVLKNNYSIENEVKDLLNDDNLLQQHQLLHGYHKGGYAKHDQELLNLMNDTWESEKLPTDIVYTAKMLYATRELLTENRFPTGSKILLVHSGGLQGNRSLKPGSLQF